MMLMGMYEVVVGVAVIIFASFIWISFAHTLGDVTDTMSDIVPNGTYVNQTAVENELQFSNDIFYFAFFVIVILVFVWMIKKKGLI